MQIDMPIPIAAYFVSDKQGAAAAIHCFTETAVVKYETYTYRGRIAINQWKMDASAKYQ